MPKIVFILLIVSLLGFSFMSDYNDRIFKPYAVAMEKSERIGVGTLKESHTESSIFSDSTTLTLTDGTVVNLDGKLNVWRPGDKVTKPKSVASTDDIAAIRLEKTWCVNSTCLEEK